MLKKHITREYNPRPSGPLLCSPKIMKTPFSFYRFLPYNKPSSSEQLVELKHISYNSEMDRDLNNKI